MTSAVNGAKFAPIPPELQVLDLELEQDEQEAGPSRRDRWADRLATVRADWSGWWLRTASPPSLVEWRATRVPHRIPDDNAWLRFVWILDFALVGVLLATVSTALFLGGAGVRWVACHPARRWLFVALTAATVGLWLA